jgi:hypothetical protein
MEEDEIKIEMIRAASMALDFLKANPNAEIEQIMKHLMKNFSAVESSKLAGIAAANYAIRFMEKNPKSTQKQVMQNLTENIGNIIESIKDQDRAKNIGDFFD